MRGMMKSTGLRKHLTAWLGLIAMCLIVLAPVVSQLIAFAHAREPVAAMCGGDGSRGDARPVTLASLSTCGYCDVLASHSAVPSAPPAIQLGVTLMIILAVSVLRSVLTLPGTFPSGRPRDPPLLT